MVSSYDQMRHDDKKGNSKSKNHVSCKKKKRGDQPRTTHRQMSENDVVVRKH